MTEEQVKAIVTVAIAQAKLYGEWVDEHELGLVWAINSDLSVVFSKTISVPTTGGTGPNSEQEIVSDDYYEEVYRTNSFKDKELDGTSALELFEDVQNLNSSLT
jgi:hypothetical protein